LDGADVCLLEEGGTWGRAEEGVADAEGGVGAFVASPGEEEIDDGETSGVDS
jgi:hypothetical protein